LSVFRASNLSRLQLLLVIQQNSPEAVVESTDIPNELNDAVQQMLLELIQTGLCPNGLCQLGQTWA
jgi:hypothetical protein